ncbi:restriction endonuclease subunit S [Vibrio nigripulchritudo]|uniref:restriction endonuclease subunit S n=1 Tax=Vibrio nigripulchritudo TaxID=28173 RepID=UPI00249137D0|nr:restriction endonuclease subunit S [Vibrio nigripulchritudo]BDU40587.1 chromosome segregation ATPase [Vibrio nigripulchritudo]BDU46324.1 chromosome segregation ATPase [Vibrio nigripulchritudo]
MSDFEKELEAISEEMNSEPEVKLPSIEEQREIVAKLKELEARGELTPEIMEEYFGKFVEKGATPIH